LSFKAPFGLKNPHLQTLFSTFFRKPISLTFTIETFELNDGDFIECYWHQHKPLEKEKKPIMVLFHGLEGSFNSPYIQGMIKKASDNGYDCVVMHFRNCAGKENRLPRSYHSGETKDAKAWITHLHSLYPTRDIFVVGYSLGGNVLLKLLGEWKALSPIKKAISISAPMSLEISANTLNSGSSKIYQKHLLKFLKASLLQKYQQHNMEKIIGKKEEEINTIKTLWEFDEIYTAPVHGFKNAKDYYTQSSAKQYLKNIITPTLIIHALDDPFMSSQILPKKAELSPSITLDIQKNGGHLGFIGGSFLTPNYWLEERVISFFKQ